MQALLFEMTPHDGHENHYFSHAAKLKPILMEHEGLLFLERFKSQSDSSRILSHSLWLDEASLARWRTDQEHHKSQVAGRYKHFKDYRIRIAHVLQYHADTSDLKEWSREGLYNDSKESVDRFVAIVKTSLQPKNCTGAVFESVTNANSFLTIYEFDSEEDGRSAVVQAQADGGVTSAILSLVSRDYGLHSRDEAPQYFKPVIQ